MTIETKYNSENVVYLLRDNKIVEGIVDRVGVKLFNTKNHPPIGAIFYTLKTPTLAWMQGEFEESTLFPSRDELIKSL